MSDDLRPRRSVLYMPGANERALEKAKTIPADALILDLEDAVAPDAKPDARDRVCAAVQSGAYGSKELAIRVNGIGTQWHEADIAAAAAAGPDAVLVPKVNSADEVRTLVAALEAAGAPERTALWAMLETPVAVLHAAEIVGAHDRLAVVVMGTNDLVKELRAQHVPGREPLRHGLQACLLAARMADKVILDGVYNDIADAEGFAAECAQGRQFGFDGKTLIHPSQVEPCNEAFAPTAAEIESAGEIIAAFEEATAAGRGVVTVNGRMIENLHVDEARRVLAQAEAIAARQPG
ncbi:HpcH/HpaI aldolase/citrate lyase family protein [Rhabdothermincola salaria]|uniref:HpcH/HpaI aldolase/citrate lyase family protein n=1 Tax=Rhabdothermincola salaria TaxID=2903142 RepID=UPI001E438D95|nr:CoA ester lyase [Rhabdothermincola salaria]MCD9623451.1 CoA ester lyase [Rhabdothermincola salaria]